MRDPLSVIDAIPEGFLSVESHDLHKIFKGPTLIHLEGKRKEPLFISVLLHGNEVTGFQAVQEFLSSYNFQHKSLPRSLSIFVGNIRAAKFHRRKLADQMDFNRIWKKGPRPEQKMAQEILIEMRNLNVFAAIDIHNNSGRNPFYGCINRLENKFYNLARLFRRTVVHFTNPDTVLSNSFADLCPSIVLECGLPGERDGVYEVKSYLETCLNLSNIPNDPVTSRDLTLFESVARVLLPDSVEFSFSEDDDQAEIQFLKDIDFYNFSEIPPNTLLGRIKNNPELRLYVWDQKGNEVGDHYFRYDGGEIRTKVPFIPSMLTLDRRIVKQDCFGYIIQPINPFSE
jgi:hypothetical protein